MDSVPEEKYYDYTLNENGRLVHYGVASSRLLDRRARGEGDRLRPQRAGRRSSSTSPRSRRICPPSRPRATSRRRSKLSTPRPNFDERNISDKPWHGLYKRALQRAGDLLPRPRHRGPPAAVAHRPRPAGRRAHGRAPAQGCPRQHDRRLRERQRIHVGRAPLGGKIWPYEESIRVPLVVRVPWQSAWGHTDSHMVLNIDFASTIAELAGVKPALPRTGAASCRCCAANRFHGGTTSWSSTSARACTPTAARHRSRRFGGTRWLYVEYRNGWRELYDLRRDPYELRNLATRLPLLRPPSEPRRAPPRARRTSVARQRAFTGPFRSLGQAFPKPCPGPCIAPPYNWMHQATQRHRTVASTQATAESSGRRLRGGEHDGQEGRRTQGDQEGQGERAVEAAPERPRVAPRPGPGSRRGPPCARCSASRRPVPSTHDML